MASSLFMADIHTIFFMTFTIGFLQLTQHDKNKNYYFLHMADIQPTQNTKYKILLLKLHNLHRQCR